VANLHGYRLLAGCATNLPDIRKSLCGCRETRQATQCGIGTPILSYFQSVALLGSRLAPSTYRKHSVSSSAISFLRHISETCLEIDVHVPRHWNYRAAIFGSRQACSHYHIEDTLSSSRGTAERLLSHLIDLYRIVCRSDDDFTLGGLAKTIKSLSPLIRDVDVDLLTNCLTRLWDNATLRNSNFLVQHDKRLARQLQEALRGQSFFIANNPEHILSMHGIRNAEIKPGDRVIPIWRDYTINIAHPVEQNDALILRPTGENFQGETIYRLIGSAYVFPLFVHGRLREPAGSFRIQVLLE
jgi:hypothetical protein